MDWSRVKDKNIYIDVNISKMNEIGARIIGGKEADPNSVPYMAAVLVNGNVFCGGSLITRSWVLTAAHCTEEGSYARIILGAHRPLQIESTQITVTSNNIINHPRWDSTRLIHDIALIKLPSQVPDSSIIHPIPIAPANSGSFAGVTGLLTGWGYTSDQTPGLSETLQQVYLQFISVEECREYAGILAHETNICTSGFNGNQNVGSCFGDSGSPIVADGVQVGVVSFGSRQCALGSITSYARVSSYADWIESYTQS
ncbi:hypothetical protein NQ314_007078 [Rhamnusium bicolor]|uniref:Peptidase S1 domain-containing protein n=1 Tax=Rhamnusium bicolor TaxID=1586634 RepID=A0AAV8YTY6_9CUCU|nr:hypothetical protein NQ314_007078 [Rhamnusium bicolor]